eukprot:scaffold3825_cov131-Cylindrotheca_fusiformis.AAC.8
MIFKKRSRLTVLPGEVPTLVRHQKEFLAKTRMLSIAGLNEKGPKVRPLLRRCLFTMWTRNCWTTVSGGTPKRCDTSETGQYRGEFTLRGSGLARGRPILSNCFAKIDPFRGND